VFHIYIGKHTAAKTAPPYYTLGNKCNDRNGKPESLWK